MLYKWNITIPQLTGEFERAAYVYVPDWYEEGSDERFPVLYMFDAHNVFLDEDATYGKSWGMLEYLEENRVPLIVAGAACNPFPEDSEVGGRLSEYAPFSFDGGDWGKIKGRGKITMDWLTKEFKPYVDENFPTLPERRYTFIAGSSMGGLMTIYALMRYNKYFSRGAALSPSVEFAPEKLLKLIERARIRKTHLYMDMGEREFKWMDGPGCFAKTAAALINKGVLLECRTVPRGKHNEASWEKQIPFFMDMLFYDLQ